MTSSLKIDSLSAGYGKAAVVNEVSLEIEKGEMVAMVGHNGAGKSTILKTVMGLVPARGGAVFFDGRDVTQLAPAERVRTGMCLVPQTGNTFPDMSVAENLELSMRIMRPDAAKRAEMLERAFGLFPDLRTRTRQKAKSLSGGQRQMLAIAIALTKQPSLLMLDEPSLGLAPMLVSKVFDSIVEINRNFGTTVLVVEQNVREALRVAKRAYLIHTGTVLVSDTSEAVLARPDLFSLL